MRVLDENNRPIINKGLRPDGILKRKNIQLFKKHD